VGIGNEFEMVHGIEHLALILIVLLGAVHAANAAGNALTELLGTARKMVEAIRNIWAEFKKF
jgi:hypothetical protein